MHHCRTFPSYTTTWFCSFLFQLLDSTVYGERKGAAYGLAGLVKGLGILFLKQLNIMSTLQEAIQDKKNYRHREGESHFCQTKTGVLSDTEPFSKLVIDHRRCENMARTKKYYTRRSGVFHYIDPRQHRIFLSYMMKKQDVINSDVI